jgi:hypothetical protein
MPNPQTAPDAPQQPMWGWGVLFNPFIAQAHVIPLMDFWGHLPTPSCPCGTVEDPECVGRYVHSSFDGREAYEHGLRKYN